MKIGIDLIEKAFVEKFGIPVSVFETKDGDVLISTRDMETVALDLLDVGLI